MNRHTFMKKWGMHQRHLVPPPTPSEILVDRICPDKNCGGQRIETAEGLSDDFTIELGQLCGLFGSHRKLYEITPANLPKGLFCHRCGKKMETRGRIELPKAVTD